jgi:hypothetical protein
MTHITFDPHVPLALWAPLALAMAALLGWYAVVGRRRAPARRWWVIIALMSVAAAVPLILLLNPTWEDRIPPPPGKPLLTVLLDRSASMATRDGENGRSRYQAVAAVATAMARTLGDRYDVRIRTFAEGSTPAAAENLAQQEPDGSATDLAAAVQEALQENQPQGQAMLLLSDGIQNVGTIDRLRREIAKTKVAAAPVYTKTLGGSATVNDLDVAIHQPQELSFVGQRVPAAVRVRQRGSLAQTIQLTLLLDDKAIERRDVALKPDDSVEEVFYIANAQSGLYRYEVRADSLPGEVSTVNNAAPLLLRVVDQPVRVLLLEGKPYWDTKFLVRTLSTDPSIELTSVVQLAEGRLLQRKIPRRVPVEEKEHADRAAPKSAPAKEADQDGKSPPDEGREQWSIEKDAGKFLASGDGLAGYQIVILGRNAEAFLTDEALARLRKWLAESEGALVCFRGSPAAQIHQRLGELMPVRWTPAAESRYHVQMTGVGQTLRWMPASTDEKNPLAELPSLAATSRAEASKALAVVLATTLTGGSDDAAPVIVYQPVGTGRVVVVEGAGMWRWAFLPPERQQQEEIYGTLWRSLVRWLVANVGLLPSQRMALRTDRLTFTTDENVTATLLVRDPAAEPPQVELRGGPSDQPRAFRCVPRGSESGQFYVGLGRLPEGRYSLRAANAEKDETSATAVFDVRGNLVERLEVSAQPDTMRLIADESGGAVLETTEPQRVGQEFDLHLSRIRPERTARTMAWDRWWALLGALAVWGVAWGLRRRSGLV